MLNVAFKFHKACTIICLMGPQFTEYTYLFSVVDPVLKPMDYVADQATTAAPTPSADDKDKEKEKKEEQKENKKDEKPPITVNMR